MDMGVVLIVIGVVAGALGVGFFVGSRTKKQESFFSEASAGELRDIQKGSKDALRERTQERKEGILGMMRRIEEVREELVDCNPEETGKGISRADVESLLGVSEDTALKYLNELEREGTIKQIGDSGRGVYYVLV
jgi:Fic family protein